MSRMRVHRNLHNARRGGPQWVETRGGRVARYLDAIVLSHVTTRIQPAGALRCRESGVRRVCAFLDGTPAQPSLEAHEGRWERLSYDPREDTAFLAGGVPFNTADAVDLRSDGTAWALNARWEDA